MTRQPFLTARQRMLEAFDAYIREVTTWHALDEAEGTASAMRQLVRLRREEVRDAKQEAAE